MPHVMYRRDKNEQEIIYLWTRLGYLWKPQAPGAGFDGVLITPSGIHVVEIKRIALGRKKWYLTPKEEQTREQVQALGQAYNIITNVEEAAALIGMTVTAMT